MRQKSSLPSHQKFILHDQTLWLSAERCIYWEDENALILSDLHLGKSGHFRKAGIAVPQSVYKDDLQRLFSLIQFYKPSKLLIVGDLFHSTANKEMELFLKWRKDMPALKIELVKGNHDILSNKFYASADINVINSHYNLKAFCFTHDVADRCKDEGTAYTFSGHIHPGVTLRGSGKQSLSFACFYFGETYAVLPAFSRFTGLYNLQPATSDQVFAIVKDEVIKIY